MTALKPVVFILLLVAVCFSLNYTLSPDGQYVWWENSNALVNCTAKSSELVHQTQYCNFTYKSGPALTLNTSFVFEEGATPRNAYIWQNYTHYETNYRSVVVSETITLENVTKIETTNDSCAWGLDNSTYRRNITIAGQFSSIYCFNSWTNTSGVYNLTSNVYQQKAYTYENTYPDWKSVGNLFELESFKQHTAATVQASWTAGQTRNMKFEYDTKPNTNGKFDIYFHIGSAEEAKANPSNIKLVLDPWWNSTWLYRVPCYVNTTVASSLTNFPAHCIIDTQSLITANKMNTSCQDLRVANSSDNALPYEIENGTCNTTTTVVWANIPATNATGNDTIYIYYGANGVTDGQNALGVWQPANYVGVWHLSNISGNIASDSFGTNNLEVTNLSSPTTCSLVTGKFGYAVNSTKGNCFLNKTIGTTGLPYNASERSITLFGWPATNGGSEWRIPFSYGTAASLKGYYFCFRANLPPAINNYTFNSYATSTWFPHVSSYTGWNYAYAGYNGSAVNVSNGTAFGTQAYALNTGNAFLILLAYSVTPSATLNYTGIIDEVRMANTTRTGAWITAEYLQTDSIGAEEGVPTSSPLNVTLNSPTNTTYTNFYQTVNVTCTGDNATYSLNVTANGAIVKDTQSVTNATAYSYTQNFSTNGAWQINATCWNGTYTNTSSNVFFTMNDTSPSVSLIVPSNNSIASNSTWYFAWMCNDTSNLTINYRLFLDNAFNKSGSCTNATECTDNIAGINGGQHYWNVECSDGFNAANATNNFNFTASNLNFVSPTPLNGVNNFTYGMTFNFSSMAVLGENSYIQIDGTNHTCQLDLVTNTSCSYTLGTYQEHIFNNSYDLKIWANISDVYYTNDTLYNFTYLGCGEVFEDGTMLGNATMGLTPAGEQCFNLTTDEIDFDCNYFTINASVSGLQNGFYGEYIANTTISNCDIFSDDVGIGLAGIAGQNDISNVNVTSPDYGLFVSGNYYNSDLTLYDVIIEDAGSGGIYAQGFGELSGDWVAVNGTWATGISVVDTNNTDFVNTVVNNSWTTGIYLDGVGHADISYSEIENAFDDGIYTNSPLNLSTTVISDIGDDGVYSLAAANISDSEIWDTVEYGIFMDNAIASTQLDLSNVSVHDSGTTCVQLELDYDLSAYNSTIFNCTTYGIMFDGWGTLQLEQVRLFNTSTAAVNVAGFGGPTTANFTNVTFDRPQGDLTDYQSMDLYDLLDLEGFTVNWTQNTSTLPSGFTSFANKFINMTKTGPNPVFIDWMSFHWVDSEVGGSDENDFKLFQYNLTNGWTLMNATPDTAGDTLQVWSWPVASDYGILEGEYTAWFIDPTPPNATDNWTYGIQLNYSTSVPMDVDDSYMEIDNINYSCTVDPGTLSSCWYIMSYDEHVYNHTYTVRGFPHIGHSYYLETNESGGRIIPYFGCGNISTSDTQKYDVYTTDANYPNCFTTWGDYIEFDCDGHSVNSTYGISFFLNGLDNVSLRDCTVYDGYREVDPGANITISGDNNTMHDFVFRSPSGFTLSHVENTTLHNIMSTNATGIMIYLAENNTNVSIDNVTEASLWVSAAFSPGGNVTVNNSDFNKAGFQSMPPGNWMNLSFYNSSFSWWDYYAFQFDYHMSINATNISIRNTGGGILGDGDLDDAWPSYYAKFNQTHFYNITYGPWYNFTGEPNAGAIFELHESLIDGDINGGLTNYTNISQVFYLGGLFMAGQCAMNVTQGIAAPPGYTMVGQMLNYTCGGVEGTEFNWSWTDAQVAALGVQEPMLGIWHYNSSGWNAENLTPDTVNNMMQLSYGDPWQAGGYALLGGTPNITAEIASPANASTSTNCSTGINLTCYGSLANYVFNVSVDGVITIQNIPIANNSYYTNSTVLANGAHNISLNCSNGTTATHTHYFTVSNAYPQVSLLLPANTTYNVDYVPLNFTYSDLTGIDKCWYRLNSTANQTLAGCANTSLTGLANGGNNVTVYVNDTCGLWNATSTRYFTINRSISITRINPPNNAWSANNPSVNFSWSATGYSAVSCYLIVNGTLVHTNLTIANGTADNHTETFPWGTHNWSVHCNDTLGNNVSTSNWTFTVGDITPPAIAYIAVTDPDGTTKFTATTSWIDANIQASDAFSGLASIQASLYKGGVLLNSTSSAASPFTVNWTGLTPGTYTFNSSADDNAGNRANLSSRTITITHVAAPVVAINYPVLTTSQYFVNATCDSASASNNLYLYIDGTQVDSGACPNHLMCQLNITPPHDCNATIARVDCQDGMGQNGTTTRTYTLEPDYVFAPADGLSITNSTLLNFTMNWTCTPNNVSTILTNPATTNAMNCSANWNCSYINNNWTVGVHMWALRTGLTSGGYVYSPYRTFIVPPAVWNITISMNMTHDMNYTDFTDYVETFYTDYGLHFLGLLAYALAWLVTQRYPQTLISGGLGMLVIYFLTGNAAALAVSILSVVIGLCYKYIAG